VYVCMYVYTYTGEGTDLMGGHDWVVVQRVSRVVHAAVL
jgi:hypothetical protein